MIKVSYDKQHNGMMYVIPMHNDSKCNRFAHSNSGTWVYYLDGKKHGRIPVIVLPKLAHIFGGEQLIVQSGYRKHWVVFQDLDTNKYYFGNYPQFSKSDCEDDRQRAQDMICIDIDLLHTL